VQLVCLTCMHSSSRRGCVHLVDQAGCRYSDQDTCNSLGQANNDGSCSCFEHHAGGRCQFSNNATCHNSGVADEQGECKCDHGHAGDRCQYSDAATCAGFGSVNHDGSCECTRIRRGRAGDCSKVSAVQTTLVALLTAVVLIAGYIGGRHVTKKWCHDRYTYRVLDSDSYETEIELKTKLITGGI
jgi:hypothetical protein